MSFPRKQCFALCHRAIHVNGLAITASHEVFFNPWYFHSLLFLQCLFLGHPLKFTNFLPPLSQQKTHGLKNLKHGLIKKKKHLLR